MGLDMAAGMIDIRPHASFGVIRFASGVLTLLVGDAYLRLDTRLVLTLAGIALLVALLASCGDGLACCGMGC